MTSSSRIPEQGGGGGLINNGVNICDLPEGCVAVIISFTTPTDACRLALVSKDFLPASESDVVWDRFLPSDCDLIASRSDTGDAFLAEFQTKKHLYRCLATQPLLLDRSTKSFWLEKSSGKKCWMIAAKSLSIAWGDTPAYWTWISLPESRFPEAAELHSVCWFDVGGKIQTSMLSPDTKYEAYLVFRTTENAYGFRQTFEASVQTVEGKTTELVYLDVTDRPRRRAHRSTPMTRSDGWLEVKIGQFFTDSGENDDQVEFSVREVKKLDSKGGLIVQGIEVRPITTRV